MKSLAQYIEPIFKKRWCPSNITHYIVRQDWPSCKINFIHAFVTKILQRYFCFHSFCFLNSKNLLSHPRSEGLWHIQGNMKLIEDHTFSIALKMLWKQNHVSIQTPNHWEIWILRIYLFKMNLIISIVCETFVVSFVCM